MTKIDTEEYKIPLPFLAVMALGVFAIFYSVIPVALEREARRQEIVQQHQCAQYGDAIAKWAAEKQIANPCDK